MKSSTTTTIGTNPDRDEPDIKRFDSLLEATVGETPGLEQPQPVDAVALRPNIHDDLTSDIAPCAACPAHELNLCTAVVKKALSEADLRPGASQLTSTTHTVPARRTICHPKEWSEFVPIVCSGWAASSIAFPDGRRQILSFLLSGDLVSATSLLVPMSGCTVESITEVTYRKFKRSDLKPFVFKHPDILDTFSNIWIEKQKQSDQLAFDLGRRTSHERIAGLILNLAERLIKRKMMNGKTMEFPLRQRHIADATGLTPVHAGKVLSEIQRAGLINISDRSLTIIDETELRRMVGWP